MNNSIDIIVTSYNRPSRVIELVNKVYFDSGIKSIIVDSGNNDFSGLSVGKIIKTTHKNQPYQRYLGFTISKANWLLYLDDDMEPIEGWYQQIKSLIVTHSDKAMIGICYKDKHLNTFLERTPKSALKKFVNNQFINNLRVVTGYPLLPQGVYYKNGVKGSMPNNSGETEHLSGGVFLAQRDRLYEDFNMQLFDFYEQRLGKGEDGILSYTVSKSASVYYYSKQLFWHNDQGNSVYTRNEFQFNKIQALSRAYLNLEYYRLNKKRLLYARLSYVNYGFWRFIGLFMNFLIQPSKTRFQGLRGSLIGWFIGMCIRYDETCSRNTIWINHAINDRDASR